MERNTKRAGTAADEPVSRSLLESLLGATTERINKQIADSTASTNDIFQGVMRDYDTGIQQQFNDVSASVASLSKAQSEMAAEQATVRKQIQKLEEVICLAEARGPAAAAATVAFDSKPDPELLRISARAMVSAAAIEKLLAPLLVQGEVPEDSVVLGGPKVGKNFVLRFSGPGGAGPRRIGKLLDVLRSNTEKLAITTPLGEQVDIFINTDKSRKQLKLEAAGRRLLRACRSAHSDIEFHLNKRDAAVSTRWTPFVRAEVTESATTFLWNHAMVSKLGIDKEKIAASLQDDSFSVDSSQWSV